MYFPPDIIDNEAKTLHEALIRTIAEAGQRRLDIATGYFAPAVWNLIGPAFQQLRQLRLLMGEKPDTGYGGHENFDLRRYYRKKIADELASLAFDAEHARLVDDLCSFLARPEVEAHIFSGPFLHAKAYVFERVSFVGSGNFTIPGLTHNSELLLSNTSEGTANQLREWFESKWSASTDYKDDLIAALQESKFGSRPYSPFDVFMKALYEYFKDRIALDPEHEAAVDLARFQEEGKGEAIRILDRWGGVLIADAVGLGKTYIGLSLLEHELITKRRRRKVLRGLVICPAQLRDLVWREKIREFALPVEVISMEELGREDFDWRRYNTVDVVLVDESHNFRNPGTNRYLSLSRLITSGKRKRVILMTATPVNNTLFDLYHQIRLIARANDSHYRDIGITNLQGYFKGAMRGGLEIFDLLEASTVRRSRADIRRRQDAGEAVIVNGQPVHFPERHLERLDYDLDGAYQGFYHAIVETIDRLNLVAYNLSKFARTRTEETERLDQRNTALIALMKMLWLKRLESSAAAFASSIQRQADFQQRWIAQLQQGKLLDAASYRKILAVEADEERPETLQAIVDKLTPVDATTYDLERISSFVNLDIAALASLREMLATVLQKAGLAGGDDKLQVVKHVLAGPYRGQKILIFTSYHDTARYLYAQLHEDTMWMSEAGNPIIDVITGETRAEERRTIIQRFAPNANRPPLEEGGALWRPTGKEIQILISTDVLSEGQNLQDAGLVLNYDLHWNPVRLIQRAGRVDRIGSQFATITLTNVFPEQDLEDLLGLVKRLSERIETIDRTVGLDASVLGEIVTARSLEQLRRLHSNDQKLLQDLEVQAELVSTEEMKFPLVSYIQQIGKRVVEDIPMGVHSAKMYRARDARPGTFLAFTTGDRHFWRFYPADGSEPETQIRTIYSIIACDAQEIRLNPGPVPFDLIERATQDILQSLRGQHARARIRPPMSGVTLKLYNWINRPSLWAGNLELEGDQRRRINSVFESVALDAYRRDTTLRELIHHYEESANFAQLVTDLDAFFTLNDLYQESDADTLTAQAIREEDLRLVCYEQMLVE